MLPLFSFPSAVKITANDGQAYSAFLSRFTRRQHTLAKKVKEDSRFDDTIRLNSSTDVASSENRGYGSIKKNTLISILFSLLFYHCLELALLQPVYAGCQEAREYSRKYQGTSLLVMYDGKIVCEAYDNGGAANQPVELASGTKSFTGIIAAAAVQDGLLQFDEKVARTIKEWQGNRLKEKVTIRQLLNLTSGIQTPKAAGNRASINISYQQSIAMPVLDEPGTKFAYGQVPFQIFGAVMLRKLKGEDPVSYLKRRILSPIGIKIGGWRKAADGHSFMAHGAQLTARNWALYGEFIRQMGVWRGQKYLESSLLKEFFEGSKVNPAYGLSWWLNRDMPDSMRAMITPLIRGTDVRPISGLFPPDLVFAAGVGSQRLYISRLEKLVVVRQSKGIRDSLLNRRRSGFSDRKFWQALKS
jgi:CubicO group peptidase (beta-lactamase class C family)